MGNELLGGRSSILRQFFGSKKLTADNRKDRVQMRPNEGTWEHTGEAVLKEQGPPDALVPAKQGNTLSPPTFHFQAVIYLIPWLNHNL